MHSTGRNSRAWVRQTVVEILSGQLSEAFLGDCSEAIIGPAP
jgi:hypothetical protein